MLNIDLRRDPAILFLGLYLREFKMPTQNHKNLCMNVIAALFIVAEQWKLNHEYITKKHTF